ncbi:MAG TPA: ATP-binding protein [Steroidobacteraceae bacterium]|nr:ATP-binding protein [Steroidobacteraceae bacterium]
MENLLDTIAALKDVKQVSQIQIIAEKAERDIKHLLDRLAISDRHLAAANVDLESFSYSVAHDLRSPIRQIAGFSKILDEEYGSLLPEEGQRYLRKISQGARQMGNLVDDLLHLAQIGRQGLALQHVSLNAVVTAALETLQPECTGRSIKWHIDELSTISCDQGLMKQAFVNLLSNALKYTQPRELAVIEVRTTNSSGEHVVFVRDNGVGFDMRFASKLFGVFQRLHPASEFEGSGIGLATVDRIVRKHGGRIWAQAEPNRGATFSFTVAASV